MMLPTRNMKYLNRMNKMNCLFAINLLKAITDQTSMFLIALKKKSKTLKSNKKLFVLVCCNLLSHLTN